MILRQAHVSGFDWVDLETDVADEISGSGTSSGSSATTTSPRPRTTSKTIYERMTQQDADVLKVVDHGPAPDATACGC